MILNAISEKKAENLVAQGKAKILPEHGILWVKVRPWKKSGQVLVFGWDHHFQMYCRPFIAKATQREWGA